MKRALEIALMGINSTFRIQKLAFSRRTRQAMGRPRKIK